MKVLKLANSEDKVFVDDELFDYLNQWEWRLNGKYISRCYGKEAKRIYLHRLITNCPKGLFVDHINGNTLDNRKSNLRICHMKQNNQNRSINKNKITSKYKGVRNSNSKTNPFRASIKTEGKTIHLGVFKTDKEAALAYDNKAKELFGEFANTNF